MEQHTDAFVGLDVAKLRHAVAVADDGRNGEIRYLGEIDAASESVRRLAAKLAKRHGNLHFCYEAGPTGYGLHRQLTQLGHRCSVIAPSLIPRKPGDRIKTNRRDAQQLARLLRAGELTEVWVPDEAHEAMRDVARIRDAAVADLRRKRQTISSMMLRLGRVYPGKKTWGVRHMNWLNTQRFEHPAHGLVMQELLLAARHAKERLERADDAIVEFLPTWSLAPVVAALQIGDLRRFENPRQLMSYLGLVPGERSTGESVRRLGITKAGNGRVRRTLIEGAWTYRHLPRTGPAKLVVQANLPADVKDIAAKAQTRLCARYRALSAKGKKPTVTVTALARELSGFVWAIGRAVQTA